MKSQWSNFSDSNRYFPSKIVVCFLDSQYSRIFRSEHHETTTLVTAEAPHFRGLTCEIVPSRRLEQVSIGDGWWLCFIKMADREMFLQLASRYLRLLQDLNVIWFTQDCEMNIIYTMYVDQPSHTYMYIVDIIFNIIYIPWLATLTGSLWLRSYGTYNNYFFVTPWIIGHRWGKNATRQWRGPREKPWKDDVWRRSSNNPMCVKNGATNKSPCYN